MIKQVREEVEVYTLYADKIYLLAKDINSIRIGDYLITNDKGVTKKAYATTDINSSFKLPIITPYFVQLHKFCVENNVSGYKVEIERDVIYPKILRKLASLFIKPNIKPKVNSDGYIIIKVTFDKCDCGAKYSLTKLVFGFGICNRCNKISMVYNYNFISTKTAFHLSFPQQVSR